ncbi:hypothetical protein GJAV_G00256570 [Gymnothorax javanicus]|nr:hypothetical protein GJAV_G00256570 [Gymnothorax javanicus]
MEGHCSVQIEIVDVNDNSPEIILTSQPSPVREDAPVGTTVALINVRDLDSGENGKVIVQVPKDSSFELKPSFSDHYALVTRTVLDRESYPEYNVEITATDSGSSPLSTKKSIPVTILDVNDNPPEFKESSYSVYLRENNALGAILCSVSAIDPDRGENAKISYSILDSKVQDVSVSSYVYINSDNGSIYSMHSFDYEKLKVLKILVQAKDHGSPSLSSNVTVHIFILDQNDNIPAVIYPSVIMGSVSHQKMPRSAKVGHLVTKVTAVDADSGHNAWISYRVVEATDVSLFGVNLYTGEVRTKRAVLEQDDASQRLLIEIKDNGEPIQSTTVTVGIILEDGVHEPISDVRQKTQEPNKKNNKITFYLIISLASISAVSFVTFVILAVKCVRNSRRGACCCIRRPDCDGYKNPNRNLQIQLNTDGPIKYVEVLGGDMMSQSQSFRSCLSPVSEFSDYTFVKPSSTSDFKDVISVLDASLPDSAWTFESQQIRYTIPEELSQGSIVGNIGKDLGLNVAAISERNLRITAEDKPYFSVDLGKGELVVSERIDRETLCGQSESCLMQLEAIIQSPLQLHRIEVEIQDINDNSPSFITKGHVLKVAEHAAPGARFPLESAQDPDVGSNALRSYSLSRNDLFSLNVKTLKDGRKIPELVLAKSLDRERHSTHELVLTAVDGGNPVKSGTAQIFVQVLDINDNPPQFEKQFYEASIGEDSPPGSVVLELLAVDLDDGLNGEIEYSFGDHTSDSVVKLFDLNPETGQLTLKGQLDYEENNLYAIDLVAKDKGSPELEGHCSVQITIVDANDNAPEIILKSLSSSTPEGAPVGTVVGLISVRDLDSSDNGKTSVRVSGNVPFTLKPSFENHYELVTSARLDREAEAEFNIEIIASDAGSPALSTKKTVSVGILDANDNPPIFSQPSYIVYVKENRMPGTLLCSVSASDPDLGENAKISYSILDSKVEDVSVSSFIYINSDNGSIFSMHSFDYEKLKVFQIQVQAKDHGSPSLNCNATVHVFILDQNDNSPTVIYPSAVLGSVSHQKMPRSAKVGHLVTKVTAVDADSGHNAWISYRVVEATDSSLFGVNLYTGEVRTKRAVSEQDDASQRLLIEIKDNGEPIQSTTVTVGILLEDGIHEPIADLRQKAQEPSKKNSKITFYLIVSLASVSAVSFVTFVILAVKCARNSRRGTCCCIRRPDYDGYKNPNRNLQIQLNTDGPIKYVEVLGGDMMSQSQSFRSCLSPVSEFSDYTFVKPSSTSDFKDVISVLDASLPDSAWTFESQQIMLQSPLEMHRIVINIVDVNDNAPQFPNKNVSLEISEAAAPGTKFQLESAQDPDVGINSLRTYSLTPNDYFILNVETKTDGSKFPELVLEKSLDREKQAAFSLLLIALDGGQPEKSGTTSLLITVLDVNDNAPVFDEPIVKVSLMENSPPGTLVTKLNATDLDYGSNGEVSFLFSKYTPERVLQLFSMDSKTGEIRVVGEVDYEMADVYHISVQARDRGTPAMEGSGSIIVSIIDVNDNSPELTITSLTESVREDAQSGTAIALVKAIDLDSSKNGEVTVHIPPGLPFKLNSHFGEHFTLVTDGPLDREKVPQYTLQITATDSGSPPRSSQKSLTITLTDVNDNAPIFSQPSYSVDIAENNDPGSPILTVTASDPDAGSNAHLSYSILPSLVGGMSVSSFVSINAETGQISTMRKLDYEQVNAFRIEVQARDWGTPPRASNVTVHVFLIDKNDNVPALVHPTPPEDGPLQLSVPRSAGPGHLISKIVCIDPDSGHNAWLSYSFASEGDALRFRIGHHTGELRTAQKFTEEEAGATYSILVVVQDNGTPRLSTTVAVSVTVEEEDSSSVSDRRKTSTGSGGLNNVTLYLIIALAVVSVVSFVMFVLLLVRCLRRRDPLGGGCGDCCYSRKSLRSRHAQHQRAQKNLHLQLNTDGPIKYMEVVGGPMDHHGHTYRPCYSTLSNRSDFVFIKTLSPSTPMMSNANTLSMTLSRKHLLSSPTNEQKPPNNDWRFSQNQRPGTSGAAPPPEGAAGTGPWPNPPTEAEQLQALMAAANEVSEATATLGPGTMGLSTRYSPQFTLQHVPDYRQNVYIPGSTATLTANQQQQQQPPQPALPQPPPQAEAPKAAPTPASKKKSAKKDKK